MLLLPSYQALSSTGQCICSALSLFQGAFVEVLNRYQPAFFKQAQEGYTSPCDLLLVFNTLTKYLPKKSGRKKVLAVKSESNIGLRLINYGLLVLSTKSI